jgi:LCP family protein required for cell wall assembly
MKRRIEPIPDGDTPRRLASDRLTQGLIWLAILLIAALSALTADLWLWPGADQPVAQAGGMPPTATAQSSLAATSLLSPTTPITATASAPTPTSSTPPPCVPPLDWGIHVVQDGNTLYSLASRYGTDVETLMWVNCLNTSTVFVGQRLYVPGLGAVDSSPGANLGEALATPTPGTNPLLGPAVAELPLPTNTPAPTLTPRPAFPVSIPDNYINIVLLGSDKRPASGAWRTDSMIVVSVDTQSKVVRLLSLPRDLWVYIPGHGYNRINTADLWGELDKRGSGPAWVKETIHHNLGIPIHYYVRIDFQGFIEIIDAVGGIDVDVECPLPDINLSAGLHHMDGKQALRYARSRKSTNDFDRGRRQRKVLMALWDQALNLDIVAKLPQLWRAMSSSFQTDMSLGQVINMAYVGVRLKPQRILSRAIGPRQVKSWVTPEGAAVLLPREDRIRELLENFYAPVDTDALDAKDKVRVQILNAAPRRQAEELAAAALRWEGFKVVSAGPAESQDQPLTRILVYSGNLTAGQEVAEVLGVPASAVQDLTGTQPPDTDQSVDLMVVLGMNYNPCQ